MKSRKLVGKIMEYVEKDHVDKAVYACRRLSMQMGDAWNGAIFLCEIQPDMDQVYRAFIEDTKSLTEEARDFIWEKTQDIWMNERDLSMKKNKDPDEPTFIGMGVGDIYTSIEQAYGVIEDLKIPKQMGEYDAAAFTDRYNEIKGEARKSIKNYKIILERIRARCLDYAARCEVILESSKSTSNFVANMQEEVQSFYADRAPDVYEKLLKASQLAESKEKEDNALLLTSIRRALKSIADYHYPPKEETICCKDGKMRKMGSEQYKNRLIQFCSEQDRGSTSKELLIAELEHIGIYLDKLYSLTSKGVHAETTVAEARQGLVGVYMFVFNMIGYVTSTRQA